MTMEEAARELGVSKSTISRALSGKGRIAESTREKIRMFAAENNLTVAKKEHCNMVQTYNLGVSLPEDVYDTSIPFFQECLLGICEIAAKNQFHVVITNRKGEDITGIKELVEKKKVDGIILTRCLEEDAAVKYLLKKKFPTALAGSCGSHKIIQVDCDNSSASKDLVASMIQIGYKRFAIILGNMKYSVNTRRMEGVQEALKEQGVLMEQQMVYTDFEKTDFLENMLEEIIDKKVECIICGDDVICTVITSGLQNSGYRVPKDVAVASLHNSVNLECFAPPITTVNVNAKDWGRMIGKQMINYLTGKVFQQRTYVNYEIQLKKSTTKVWK